MYIPGLKNKKTLVRHLSNYKYLYLLLIPLVVYYIIFCYLPMYGIVLAFKSFDYSKGIIGSPWNNFQNFKDVFSNPGFWNAFRNTLIISLGRLIIEFPVPIILALLFDEISHRKFSRIFQTIFTFPHFLSWIILSGIIITLLGNNGVINQLLAVCNLPKNSVLMDGKSFLGLVFISNIWKEAGWSTIIYLAAISGINPELYEAADIDGANRFQKTCVITLPAIKNTTVILLLLAVGNMMNGGFDQIFNLYNPTVYNTSDILDTFVYRSAFTDATGFGFSTTVGFMKSILNFVLLYGANCIAKALGNEGVF
jgi:putative aldouronate transport system permease protein